MMSIASTAAGRWQRLRPHLPSGAEWLASAKTFGAAMAALYLAFAAGLPRPYWAMATVYVVSAPLAGATRSKGLYRVMGTCVAGCAAVLLLPLLVGTPLLMSVVVAAWVGGLLWLSLRERLPGNYVYMLAAYSLPMLMLPAVQAPDQVFMIAVARCEEILLGMGCAALVSVLVLPGRTAPVLQGRFAAWLDDAAAWGAEVLLRTPDAARRVSVHRLAGDVLALDQFIHHLGHDGEHRDAVDVARELRQRLALLLPLLGSLRDTLARLAPPTRELPGGLGALLDDVARWLRQPPSDAARIHGEALLQRLQPLQQAAPGLPLQHALRRLESLVQLWLDCRALQRMLADGRREPGWAPVFTRWGRYRSAHFHDRGLQAHAALSAAGITFLACQFWIFSAWADGASAVVMCAVIACFFASQDEPAPLQHTFVWVNVLCVALCTLLLFGVLPQVQEFFMLALVLAPVFLMFGVFVSRPAFAVIAMGLGVTVATSLGLSETYDPDFTAFFNAGVASVVGGLAALVWTRLTRPFGTRLSARRLLRATLGDLARTAAGHHRGDHERLRARMLDRLGQLMPRLAATRGAAGQEGLAELRAGLSASVLQRARVQLQPTARESVQRVLDALALHYRRRLRDPAVDAPPPGALLQRRLAAAVAVLAADTDAVAQDALHALLEVQLTLPDSP